MGTLQKEDKVFEWTKILINKICVKYTDISGFILYQ